MYKVCLGCSVHSKCFQTTVFVVDYIVYSVVVYIRNNGDTLFVALIRYFVGSIEDFVENQFAVIVTVKPPAGSCKTTLFINNIMTFVGNNEIHKSVAIVIDRYFIVIIPFVCARSLYYINVFHFRDSVNPIIYQYPPTMIILFLILY